MECVWIFSLVPGIQVKFAVPWTEFDVSTWWDGIRVCGLYLRSRNLVHFAQYSSVNLLFGKCGQGT